MKCDIICKKNNTLEKLKKKITTIKDYKNNLFEELKQCDNEIKNMEKKLIEECIKNGTHKYERDYDCLSYGDIDYKCSTCGLYR